MITESSARKLADRFVDAIAELNPLVAVELGLGDPADDRLPDYSPAGTAAVADLARRTLAELDAAQPGDDPGEQRCATLLRERLTAELAVHDSGEFLRTVRNMESPLHLLRSIFTMLPTETEDHWRNIGARLARMPLAVQQYTESLTAGKSRGLLAAPRQVTTVIEQLDEWVAGGPGGWFGELISPAPESVRPELETGAVAAAKAIAEIRDWLRTDYLPATAGTPDAVGERRYRLLARYWNGADLDLHEAYEWGWEQFHDLEKQMRQEAERVRPGATPGEAMQWLATEGPAIEGVEEARIWLQGLMDRVIADLNGTHFDLAEPLERVESKIAPPGSASAPYYTPPSLDFSRPGRTWLPAFGRTRFPEWEHVSTWYHEGVPGHHLQFGQWTYCADKLSKYQVSLGMVSANVEGWALYAERLMDELGYLTDPGHRLGYLNVQMLRALRVVLDIGMHLELEFPAHSPFRPGETMLPGPAREFFGTYCGLPGPLLDSEIVRYLGWPAQAIGYKLGERAWLRGRAAAEAAKGAEFDLKAWHMAALSMGSLGLDDLERELARL
ncbi:DUF885 domain-containing protein [Nocardia sp. CDC159]|uniref:DUF885 domain-containing protein n=1 Tax=Nocardia pulmonis TaxID=2951408 RepID=A0A9X2EDH0_9NOCA|nr:MULTISPECIES: DUF885 domain-containing protein [Nocardia]MCM6777138.1 DUF885 domain-containing protein [Nocardia pulmonis]MCM6790023.1 DUF885 domain-containing protein [Nocardia sp. CDC159]